MDHSDHQLDGVEDVDMFSNETHISLVPPDDYEPEKEQEEGMSDPWDVSFSLAFNDRDLERLDDLTGFAAASFASPGDRFGFGWRESTKVAHKTASRRSPTRERSGSPDDLPLTPADASFADPVLVESLDFASSSKSHVNSIDNPSVILSSDFTHAISPIVNGPNQKGSQKSAVKNVIASEVGDTSITSVEQEGKILSRIAELRKVGRWEDSRIPKCVIASPFSRGINNFTKEVCWVATLIAREKKQKMAMAKKIAYAVKRWHEKREEQKRKQEREERLRLRKVAKHMGSLVMAWWQELGKVAQLKQKEEIEIQKKRIRDLHLRHLMDQTEEFSSRMAQGLSRTSTQLASMDSSTPAEEEIDPQDIEFELDEDSDPMDEEDTISDEEKETDLSDQQQSEEALLEEADLPIEELLKRYGGYEESFLVAEEAPSTSSKRRRTLSRKPDFEYQTEKKKKRDDDLSVLVQPSSNEEPSSSISENASFDDKIRKREEAMDKLKPKGNSLSSTEVVTKVPFLLRGSLREYQHVGLDWLVSLYHNKMNGILADEMGLGKTIQTIAFIAHLASAENKWGPHLVIVPTSVILNWELEFKRWCPGLIIKTYYGSRKQRLDLRTGWTKPDAFHVCITSYKVATQDYSSFRRMRWQYLILDEAQAIKNYKSQRWTRIAEFPSHRRLLLTGTPMQNSLEEVWALLHFLAPELFESLNMFQQLFANPMTAMSEGKKPQDNAIIKQLHTVLRPFILRRMKSEVETQLPKKFEHVVPCRLSKRQRYLYDDYMSRTKTKETLAAGNYLSVINILMQLRKVCNHPNLFEERPVLSPLVVAPMQIRLPGLVFEALNSSKDSPYMKEVSTIIRLPFWHSPSGLFSTDTSLLQSLVPPDDKLTPLRDEGREIAPPEISLPKDFPTVMDSIELTMTDMMAGTPFVPDDERLCTEDCTHPPAPPVKAFSTVATVHTGRIKRTLKNGTKTPMRNGTKKMKHNSSEVNPAAPVRVSSKRFTDDVVPLLMKQQRGDHYDVFVASNRRKCELKPLVFEDVLNFVKLKNGDSQREKSPWSGRSTSYGRCLEAQEEVLEEGLFRKDSSPLQGITEMGASVERCLKRRDVSFWLESMSLAYAPVMTSTPVLNVANMPLAVFEKKDLLEKQLMPVMKRVSEVLHPVERLRVLKFPETRLIQYDCGKLQALDDLLKRLFAGSHRVLIFTQMTKVLDILEIFLTYHGYKYLRLDGSTGIEMRQTLMDRFNRDKRYFCFILSTRSGGVGVNLTGADTVVFYDSDWNPTMDAQAQDRCHRIGQTRDVHIYRLISEYTVEENIYMKASQKKYLGQLAIESGDFTTAVLKKENFKEIFGLKEGDAPSSRSEEQSSQEAPAEEVSEAAFEAAISKAEDDDDAEAARKAKAEAKVEEEEEDDDDDQPKFKAIQKLLAPIQCYGVLYLENHVLDQDVMEELEQTREEVERRKKEWELNRLEIAKAEKIKAAEEAVEPFVVPRSLMDPKFYQDIFTGEHPEFIQDVDIPTFHFREVVSPSSDKENNVKDYLAWGPLYRNPPAETQLPNSKRKSAGKRLRKDKSMPDPLVTKTTKRKKLDHLAPLNFDPMVGKGLRLPPHMGLPRDLYGSGYDIPDTLAGLENASADWKPFEDWQIVTTSSVLQNIPPSAINPTPIPTTGRTSFDLVSYVSSTSNLRFRVPMDCQVRVKTLRMREDKESPVDVGPTPVKKKKKSKAEDQILDKAPGSVPKKIAVAVQEDGGRSRSQLYKDVFGAFRNQNYTSPLVKRDLNAFRGNPVIPGSAGLGLPETSSNPDELITPLAALKKRQERSTVSRAFLHENTLKWAQALNVAVDIHGQLASSHMLSPSPNKSILQQTLQQGPPRTPNTPGGPLLAGGPQTPGSLPSPQTFIINANMQQRRQVFMPNNSVPSPVAPQSSSPLPSLQTTGINQYMGNMVASSSSGGMTGTSATVSTSPMQSPATSMYGPIGQRNPIGQQNGGPQIAQTQQQKQQSLLQVKDFLTKMCPPGVTPSTDSVNYIKLKDFLVARGISFNEKQISELLTMFGGRLANAAALLAPGSGQSNLGNAQSLPTSVNGQASLPASPSSVSTAPTVSLISAMGNLQKQPSSPLLTNNTQVTSVMTPVNTGPTITAIASRPILGSNQAVVRLQAVPTNRTNGPGTVTVNFPASGQASTSVRAYTKRTPASTVRMTAPLLNGPATSSVSQIITPVVAKGATQVSILPSSTKASSTAAVSTASNMVQWSPQQFHQVMSLQAPGTHVVTPATNGVFVRRNVPNVVVVPTAITPTSIAQTPSTTLRFQMVSTEGKSADQMTIGNSQSPSAGTQPEPN